MRLLLLLILFSFCYTSYSQRAYDSSKISGLVKKIAKQIAKQKNGFDSILPMVMFPEDSEIRNLKKFSKDYELLELTNYPNALVRFEAFRLLYDTVSPLYIEVLEKNFYDTASLMERNGCIIDVETVVTKMFSYASGQRGRIRFKTPEQLNRLEAFFKRYSAFYSK